jgi:hypothetical protein
MDRARLSFLTVFICAFLGFIFVIVALATKEWIIVQFLGTKICSFGLWEYCILDKCYVEVAIVPAVLTIVTTVLILISLVVTLVMSVQKRISAGMFFIPVTCVFVSIIILFATIVVVWPELLQRSYTKFIGDIFPELKSSGWGLNARKSGGSTSNIYDSDGSISNIWNTFGSGLEGLNLDDLALNEMNLRKIIAIKHGFSSILLITTLPLLVICLVAITFVAAFRKAECIATNNHADVATANRH